MKNIALAVTIFGAVVLTGCSVNRGGKIEPEQDPPLPASMKGYELYSWYVEPEDEWYYTLITAANRLKTYEEITSAEKEDDGERWVKITVKGVDSLKEVLGRLPEGEAVVWIEDPEAARTSGEDQNFAFPEQTVVEAIEQHARSLGLELHLAGRDLSILTASPITNSLISTASTTTFTTTLTPTPASLPTPIPLKTGPMVDIPGSNYGVIELSHLDPPACCLTVAPDGAQLAFATCRTMVQKVYVQNVDGSGIKEISSLRINNGDGPCPDPAWSPDGRQLAFVDYDYGLYVVNADGTNLTRLEPAGRAPAWSPDGQQIALTAHHSQKGLAIAVMNRNSSYFKLLTGYEAHDQRPAWSPDGRQIAFVSDRDDNREIYVMNNDGSDQRRLTDHEAQDWGAVWSPDGRHIVFTSDRRGHNGIYVMNNDGTDQRWLLDTDAPQWWPLDTTRVRFIDR